MSFASTVETHSVCRGKMPLLQRKDIKSSLAYFGLCYDEPEINLLNRLCWYGVRMHACLHSFFF